MICSRRRHSLRLRCLDTLMGFSMYLKYSLLRSTRSSVVLTAVIIVSLFASVVSAQTRDTLRIMAYNLLNFPGSNQAGAARIPYFRTTIHYTHPDILVSGELNDASGLPLFRDQALNVWGDSDWLTSTYIDGNDTQIGLFYRSSKVRLINQTTLETSLRLIYVFRMRPIHSDSTGDFYIFGMHLKASQGYESNRLAEATIARNYANSLPSGARFIYCGDMNFYTNTEPAYTELTGSLTNNNGRAFDPVASGVWHDGEAYRYIHTQSSRISSLSDGGVGGGLDDRFDFLLPSVSLQSETGSHFIVGSHRTVGNDGNRFNGALISLPNGVVPDSVALALYYGADHLPIYADFVFVGSNAAPEPRTAPLPEISNLRAYPNPFNATTLIRFDLAKPIALHISIVNEQGREIATIADRLFSAGQQSLEWNATGVASGNYFAQITDNRQFKQTIALRLVK